MSFVEAVEKVARFLVCFASFNDFEQQNCKNTCVFLGFWSIEVQNPTHKDGHDQRFAKRDPSFRRLAPGIGPRQGPTRRIQNYRVFPALEKLPLKTIVFFQDLGKNLGFRLRFSPKCNDVSSKTTGSCIQDGPRGADEG